MKDTIFLHNDEYYYEIVRANIRKIRREHKLTQQDLADLTGLSRQYICDIENTRRNKHLSIAVLGRMADALNLNIIEFFIDDELRIELKSILNTFYNTEKEAIKS